MCPGCDLISSGKGSHDESGMGVFWQSGSWSERLLQRISPTTTQLCSYQTTTSLCFKDLKTPGVTVTRVMQFKTKTRQCGRRYKHWWILQERHDALMSLKLSHILCFNSRSHTAVLHSHHSLSTSIGHFSEWIGSLLIELESCNCAQISFRQLFE